MGILAVWRVTHLLHAEDGPWDVLFRLRRRAGTGVVGALMDCLYCLSLWAAAPVAYGLGETWKERLLLWPALSGGAILLERLTRKPRDEVLPALTYFEEPGEQRGATRPETEVPTDELLRRQERTASGAVDVGASTRRGGATGTGDRAGKGVL